VTHRVTICAHLHHLLVQTSRESAQHSKTVVSVSKHDERLDAAVKCDWDVVCGGVHDARALGVTDEREELVGARSGLSLEAVHDVGGALAGAADDIRAGGILTINRVRGLRFENDDWCRTDLDRITPGAWKSEGGVADYRVANNNAELATCCIVRLARSTGWMCGQVSI